MVIDDDEFLPVDALEYSYVQTQEQEGINDLATYTLLCTCVHIEINRRKHLKVYPIYCRDWLEYPWRNRVIQ